MKIRIDDITRTIEHWEDDDWVELYKGEYRSFNKLLEQVLTTTQFSLYIGNETRRTFTISKKKSAILNELIK